MRSCPGCWAAIFRAPRGLWDGLLEGIEVDDVATILIEPRLLFFVLFEACKDPESLGCRLGRFGSILVADTLFGELSNNGVGTTIRVFG
jgi:hypothetical protein